MRTWLALLSALMLGSFAVACAPRQNKTHYTRWAEETDKRKEEEAKEEAAKGKATADVKKGQPAQGTSSPPPPAKDYSSLPPGDTPDITRTSTRSRVVRPEPPPPPPDDGDVIY
jgi:hypothetical protein